MLYLSLSHRPDRILALSITFSTGVLVLNKVLKDRIRHYCCNAVLTGDKELCKGGIRSLILPCHVYQRTSFKQRSEGQTTSFVDVLSF